MTIPVKTDDDYCRANDQFFLRHQDDIHELMLCIADQETPQDWCVLTMVPVLLGSTGMVRVVRRIQLATRILEDGQRLRNANKRRVHELMADQLRSPAPAGRVWLVSMVQAPGYEDYALIMSRMSANPEYPGAAHGEEVQS